MTVEMTESSTALTLLLISSKMMLCVGVRKLFNRLSPLYSFSGSFYCALFGFNLLLTCFLNMSVQVLQVESVGLKLE